MMKKLICVALAILLLLTGCGKTSTPSKAAESFMKSIQGQKKTVIEEIEKELPELTKSEKKVLENVVEMVLDFKYEATAEKITGDDKAMVDVKITGYNIVAAFPGIAISLLTDSKVLTNPKEARKVFFDLLSEELDKVKKDGKTASFTIKVPAIKKGNNWEVSEDSVKKVLIEPLEKAFETYSYLFN